MVRSYLLTGLLLVSAAASQAADPDVDPLSLGSAPAEPGGESKDWKLQLEGAFGRGERRFTDGHESLSRWSADFVQSQKFPGGWRMAVSARLDRLSPHDQDQDATILSLREAYVGWQDREATWVVEAGRINLRQGPALGFNPTDFFRDGALRVSTTVNPYLVREYRMGNVMLRTQRLWSDGSVSLAISPKLDDEPSSEGISASLGATNNRNRALATLGSRHSDAISSQVHLYVDDDASKIGASVTALLGDAVVSYAEGSWGRGPLLLESATGSASARHARAQAAAGFTYTTATKLSVTVEWHHNGFALSRSEWQALRNSRPDLLGSYLYESQRLQDPTNRNALLIFARQTDFLARNFDLTGLWRINAGDRSHLTWLELRHHFGSMDLALQYLRYRGELGSENGSNPYRRTVQATASFYF